MNESNDKFIIDDNKLTSELRIECEIIDKIKNMPLEERRLYYEQLSKLCFKLIENKNKNFDEYIKKLKNPFYETIDIYIKVDKETELFIREIYKIITNKLD